MTKQLKPCPFCGSDRVTIWNAGGGQQAVCKDCRATGPVFTREEAWRQAFTAWNMRTRTGMSRREAARLIGDTSVNMNFDIAGIIREAAPSADVKQILLDAADAVLSDSARQAPNCDICGDASVWPTADGIGHRCSCGAGA